MEDQLNSFFSIIPLLLPLNITYLVLSVPGGVEPGAGGPEPVPPVRHHPLSASDHPVLSGRRVQGCAGLSQ